MDNFSKLQLLEISRLLDERYCLLCLRMRRFRFVATEHSEWKDDVEREMELIDSILKVL